MRFAALGRTHWLRDAIVEALARKHQLVLVATAPAAPEYESREADFEMLARSAGCDFLNGLPLNSPEAVERARRANADVAISVNWPTLIGKTMRAQFKYGVINAHAGDLPRFRGNACANWAILTGEPKVVLTLHEMADELDAGAILLQREMPLTDEIYIADVHAFFTQQIPAMFGDLLDALAGGPITRRAQSTDPAKALRCYPRIAQDGFLDWQLPAEILARVVRASAEPYAGAFYMRPEGRVTVWRARAVETPCPTLGVPGQVASIDRVTGHVDVLTGGGLLRLEQVQLPGAPRRKPAEVIISTRERLTVDLVHEYLELRQRVERLEAMERPPTTR